MPSTATVTAKTGPALTATAMVLTGVTKMNFVTFPTSTLQVVCDQGQPYFDIQADTTLTATISAGVITLTIS